MSQRFGTRRKHILVFCVLFLMAYSAAFLRVDSMTQEELRGCFVQTQAQHGTAGLFSMHSFSAQNTELMAEKLTSEVIGNLLQGRLVRLSLLLQLSLLCVLWCGSALMPLILWKPEWLWNSFLELSEGGRLICVLHRADGKK